jgi:hypothetical protein
MATATQKYIIRCDRAGVFYAEIQDRRGDEADLVNARRVHSWQGAASCSQMALDGVGNGSNVSMTVPAMTVLGVIEVIPCSDKAMQVFDALKEWKV